MDKVLYGQVLGLDVAYVTKHGCVTVTQVKPEGAVARVSSNPLAVNQLLTNDFIVKTKGETFKDIPEFLSSVNQAADILTFTVLREVKPPLLPNPPATAPATVQWLGGPEKIEVKNQLPDWQDEPVGAGLGGEEPDDKVDEFNWGDEPAPWRATQGKALKEAKKEEEDKPEEYAHDEIVDMYVCPPDFEGGMHVIMQQDDKPKEYACVIPKVRDLLAQCIPLC